METLQMETGIFKQGPDIFSGVNMMPPKKSKAAREKGEHVENGTDTDAPEPKEGSKEPKAKAAAEKEPTDIFATQIVDGKRKREAPPAEKFLHTW